MGTRIGEEEEEESLLKLFLGLQIDFSYLLGVGLSFLKLLARASLLESSTSFVLRRAILLAINE